MSDSGSAGTVAKGVHHERIKSQFAKRFARESGVYDLAFKAVTFLLTEKS